MREDLGVVPHCRLDDASPVVTSHLQAERWRVAAPTRHRAGDIMTVAARQLVDAPGAHVLVAHDVVPAGAYEPITVVRTLTDTPSPWDPRLLAALSAATGGWAYGVLVDRWQLAFGLAAFYAGRTLVAEFEGADDERFGWRPRGPRLDEALTRDAWARLHTHVARTDPHGLHPVAEEPALCWVAHPPPEPPAAFEALTTLLMVRAVFPAVTEAQLRAALAVHAPAAAVTVVERATAVLQTPYVLADGELSWPGFVAVARALGGTAVRLELGGGTDAVTWTEVADGEVRGGTAHGALALATVLGAVALPLDEPVSAIR